MAEQHGGMRRPANPAPVSGPGALSQRTDGGPAQPMYVSGMPYGEGQDFMDLQSSAPLGAEAAKPRSKQGRSQGGASLPTPLFAPTQRPEEPVTAGAPFGPGGGPESTRPAMDQDMQALKQYLPDLEIAAGFRNAPSSFKMLVNYLRNA